MPNWCALCESNHGSVGIYECECCYRFEYNNIVMTLNLHALNELRQEIKGCFKQVQNWKNRADRNVCFHSTQSNLIFIYSVQEVEELDFLLESALLKIETYA